MDNDSECEIIDLDLDADDACTHPEWITTIDPGETNMGTVRGCLHCYRAASEEKVNLRYLWYDYDPDDENAGAPPKRLSPKDMRKATAKWVRQRPDLFRDSQHIYPERQIVHGPKSNPFMKALQDALETLIDPERITFVSPNSVKTHFGAYFGTLQQEDDDPKDDQYHVNKDNAVIAAKSLMTEDELRMLRAIKGKKDDVCDAWWIMRYIFDLLQGKHAHVVNRKRKRRTRASARNAQRSGKQTVSRLRRTRSRKHTKNK